MVKILDSVNPCPFCFNGENIVAVGEPGDIKGSEDWYVECRSCLARGPLEPSFAEALDAWGNDMGVIDDIMADMDEDL